MSIQYDFYTTVLLFDGRGRKTTCSKTMICGWMSFQYNSALAVLKLSVYRILFKSSWNFINVVAQQISQQVIYQTIHTNHYIHINYVKYSFMQG